MKKGSRLIRCKDCNRKIFWKIPVGMLLGFQEMKAEKIYDYRYTKQPNEQFGKYVCIDCYKKYNKQTS